MTNQALTKHRDSFLEGWNSETNQQRIKRFLPKDVSPDTFTAVVLRAVQEDPSLLAVDDKTSLFLACQRAAQDGLMPDKKEGALVVYKVKDGDRYLTKVQWQPMIHGLRKKLANHGFDMRAEIVYENDTFDYDLGDDPKISHKRPPLGQERGNIIGAYAIATESSTGRKYREVMTVQELDAVAATSKAKFGPWSGPFKPEMYRKTVAKRLYKQLPLIATDMLELIDRDNEQFTFDTLHDTPAASEAATSVQSKVRSKAAKKKEPEPEPDNEALEGEYDNVPDGDEYAMGEQQEPDF